MSVTPLSTLALDHRFARELPEMATVWQAEPVPDARLLVLDGALAAELGLDASWLRSPDGVGPVTISDILDQHPAPPPRP